MKFLGLEFYIDHEGVDLGEGVLFLPYPNVRRYEEIIMTSTKKEGGNVGHEGDLNYSMWFPKDPVSLKLSRNLTSRRLRIKNEKILQDKPPGERVISRDYLFNEY